MKLNIGCGEDIRKGWINIDRKQIKGVNMAIDIDNGIPLGSNVVDEIYCSHALEYVSDLDYFFYELHRVCKNKATIEIIVPHFSSYTAYHCNAKHIFRWYEGLADYCISNHNHLGYEYFNLLHSEIRLEHHLKWLNKVINQIPHLYERTFLKSMFPAYEVYFKLEVKK